MRTPLLLAPLLAMSTVLGGHIPDPNDTVPTTGITGSGMEYHFPLDKRSRDWDTSNYGGFQGQHEGWQSSHGFPVKMTDKFVLLRYSEPNCQGKMVRNFGDDMKADSEKHFKKWEPTQSMRYALPSDGHLSLVDITFYNKHVRRGKDHYCAGNIILKLNGAIGETMDSDRYPCHPIPKAKCITVGRK